MSTASLPHACVHIVDDEADIRAALSFLFTAHGLPVRSHENGLALLQEGEQHGGLRGCVVLDVRMEPMSGLQVYDELHARAWDVPVIFLSGHGDIRMAVEALKKGAYDFVEKPLSNELLVERVQEALAHDAERQVQREQGQRQQLALGALTRREVEVMKRVAAGKLNKVIADELCLSMRMIEVYRARVFAKLGVRSAAELATRLAQQGGAGQ